MAVFILEPTRGTLHGKFSREIMPVLAINPGDTVCYRTLDAGWGLEQHHADGSRRLYFEPRDREQDRGHCLSGPVAVKGAEPGMTLGVHVEAVVPGAWGWTRAGGWESQVNGRLSMETGEEVMHLWALDAETMTGRSQHGHQVKLRPFMGVMGMPPSGGGLHSTGPPRVTGGNLDCKELTAGSTLYLPIAVPEALFSVGDGHAVQGDGEVCGNALECPMERVTLTFSLHDDMPLTTPRIHTPEAWLTLGLHEDLDEAMALALDAMLSLMGENFGLDRRDALALASLVVDLRITQVVNEVNGVHAVLPHDALGI